MQEQRNATKQGRGTPAIISFALWLRQIGRSDTTGWRWVKNGWLTPVNIAGKLYLTADDIEQFEARAIAGEFARGAMGAARQAAEARIAKGNA